MAREYPTPVLADAGYGVVTAFRDALTVRGLSYMVGITTQTTLWPPGLMPLPPRKWRGQGRPAMKLLRNTPRHRPIAVVKLAMALPARSWGTIRNESNANALEQKDFQNGQLSRSSYILPAKRFTFQKSLIMKVGGTITESKRKEVVTKIVSLLAYRLHLD